MIKNEKQYQTTNKRLKEFSETVRVLGMSYTDGDLLKQIQIDALKSQIEDFNKELLDYEMLKKGLVTELQFDSISRFPELLIKSRITKGWSHAQLAEKLGIDEQQIQRYESTDYSTASFARIVEVFNALEIQLYPFKVKVKDVKFKRPVEVDEATLITEQKRLSQKHRLFEICN